MRIKQSLLASMLASILLVIAGCGGGSSSTSTLETAEGRFLDSAVEGITYTSGDITGTTDVNGTFTYVVGGSVVFSIGSVVLGTADGASVLTPLDLVPSALDETDDTVVNILRFLQTLDADGDPDTGITITATIQNLLTGEVIDFVQTTAEFETDPALLTLLSSLPLSEIGDDSDLVDALTALTHFQITLATLDDTDVDIDTDEMIEISESDLLSYQAVGVWRTLADFSFTSETSFVVDSQIYTTSTTASIASNDVSAIQEIGSGYSVSLGCYVNGPETIDDSEFSFTDEEEYCEDQSYRFYRTDDATAFAMVLYCGTEAYGRVDIKQLTTTPVFDLGALNFSSSFYSDLSSSDGVCGQLQNVHTTTTVSPALDILPDIESKSYEIAVMAPYGNQYLMFYFEFLNKPAPGIFNVSNAYTTENLNSNEVLVRIHTSAAEMGGSLDDVEVIRSVSGTVTLNALGELNAAGSFDLVMDNSDDISGNFTFVLE